MCQGRNPTGPPHQSGDPGMSASAHAREGGVEVYDAISLLTRPAGTLPGQRMINGVRIPPSIAVKYVLRHGPFAPPQGLLSGPLSLVKMTSVLSSMPALMASRTGFAVVHLREISAHRRYQSLPANSRLGSVGMCTNEKGM